MPLASGSHLGPYEILESIGAGGMGEVYRARDTRLARDVAIKVSAQQFSERFEREARVIASVNHPNICTLHDIGPDYLVMELIEGPTLADRIKEGPIPLEESLTIAKQIADALEAAHEQGITHRDLKPANIKIKSDGMVKVLDFGLAKSAVAPSIQTEDSPTIATGLTQEGVIIGTAAYMSPEQAKGKTADKRSDIWAFGVVLYEMITGTQLFQGETFSETLAAVLRQEVDWKPIPAKVERLLRRCLERDPKLRVRDIGDYRLLLEHTAREIAPSQSRRGLVGWLVALIALAALIATVVLLRPVKPPSLPLLTLNVDLGPNFVATAEMTAILSPDGMKLLHVARKPDGEIALALLSLTDHKETLIPGTDNAAAVIPFFSPDGQWIGFSKGSKVNKISVAGGAPIELASASGRLGASWDEDGNLVVAMSPTSGLWLRPAGGGKLQPLTTLAPGEATHRYPQVIPGTDAVLFTAGTAPNDFDDATIQVVSMKTGKTKRLVPGYFGRYAPSNGPRGHVLYVQRGTLFAVPFDPVKLEPTGKSVAILDQVGSAPLTGAGRFDVSSDPSGTGVLVYSEGTPFSRKLLVLSLDSSGKTQTLIEIPARYNHLRFSPDGQSLALTLPSDKGRELYVYDIGLKKLTQLTFNGRLNSDPVWAPDNKHLAFSSGDGILWIRADGGSEPQLLLSGKIEPDPFSFSPNGERLAYSERNPGNPGTNDPGTNADIWTLPLDLTDPEHPKPQKPELFLNDRLSETQPAFSADGRWIAYRTPATDPAVGEVWVRAFPDRGDRWKISTGGGRFPIWSRSRTKNQLFFEKDGQIMVVDYSIKADSFVPGDPRPWLPLQSMRNAFTGVTGQNIDLAPDGEHFVILDRPVGLPEPAPPLSLMLHFFDELRRRAPEGN